MLNCFREKEPAGVAGMRLIIDPGEEVLVQKIEQQEGRQRETIDDWRYDGIAERDDNQLSNRREECSPFRSTGRVLDLQHRAWGRSKKYDFDIIHHERYNLKKAAACFRKTLMHYKSGY